MEPDPTMRRRESPKKDSEEGLMCSPTAPTRDQHTTVISGGSVSETSELSIKLFETSTRSV
jgi:hypothetical protein